MTSVPKFGRKVAYLRGDHIPVSRSNGQRSGFAAGGGIPCRPKPAAMLLVFSRVCLWVCVRGQHDDSWTIWERSWTFCGSKIWWKAWSSSKPAAFRCTVVRRWRFNVPVCDVLVPVIVLYVRFCIVCLLLLVLSPISSCHSCITAFYLYDMLLSEILIAGLSRFLM